MGQLSERCIQGEYHTVNGKPELCDHSILIQQQDNSNIRPIVEAASAIFTWQKRPELGEIAF